MSDRAPAIETAPPALTWNGFCSSIVSGKLEYLDMEGGSVRGQARFGASEGKWNPVPFKRQLPLRVVQPRRSSSSACGRVPGPSLGRGRLLGADRWMRALRGVVASSGPAVGAWMRIRWRDCGAGPPWLAQETRE